jgi:regulatory protein
LIITKIRRSRGKRGRYGIYLDGSLTLEISDWTIGKFGLRTGDELDEEGINRIKTAEAETHAKNLAINYISYRPRSSKEVIDHLMRKGFERECADGVVKTMQSLKFINDLEFAHMFVRDRLKRKPTGQALIRQQLLLKGIPVKTVDKVISDLISPQSQQIMALEAAKRKLKLIRFSRKKIDVEKQRKRTLDFLLRRGFSYEIASKTIRTILDR